MSTALQALALLRTGDLASLDALAARYRRPVAFGRSALVARTVGAEGDRRQLLALLAQAGYLRRLAYPASLSAPPSSGSPSR